jgi:hypothetical protein
MKKGAKVLLLDIETSPMLLYGWGLYDQNFGLNQIFKDWHLLSWSAKWLTAPKKDILYMDQRKAKHIEDDSLLLRGMWELLDAADVVVTQNGKSFDTKKLNARFISKGFQPPSSYKQIDTYLLAKKYFGFTSNKLEYMAEHLGLSQKKLKPKKFPGFEMWAECLKGNLEAWEEMEKYNRQDVLALEELYLKMIPWDNSVNFNLYNDELVTQCSCGSEEFKRNGYAYTATGQFQRYKCTTCGSEIRDRNNLLSSDKKKSLKSATSR